jgi:hypothetical protein
MNYDAKKHIMISGYHKTALQLQESFDEYQTIFSRHGIRISESDLERNVSFENLTTS